MGSCQAPCRYGDMPLSVASTGPERQTQGSINRASLQRTERSCIRCVASNRSNQTSELWVLSLFFCARLLKNTTLSRQIPNRINIGQVPTGHRPQATGRTCTGLFCFRGREWAGAERGRTDESGRRGDRDSDAPRRQPANHRPVFACPTRPSTTWRLPSRPHRAWRLHAHVRPRGRANRRAAAHVAPFAVGPRAVRGGVTLPAALWPLRWEYTAGRRLSRHCLQYKHDPHNLFTAGPRIPYSRGLGFPRAARERRCVQKVSFF